MMIEDEFVRYWFVDYCAKVAVAVLGAAEYAINCAERIVFQLALSRKHLLPASLNLILSHNFWMCVLKLRLISVLYFPVSHPCKLALFEEILAFDLFNLWPFELDTVLVLLNRNLVVAEHVLHEFFVRIVLYETLRYIRSVSDPVAPLRSIRFWVENASSTVNPILRVAISRKFALFVIKKPISLRAGVLFAVSPAKLTANPSSTITNMMTISG